MDKKEILKRTKETLLEAFEKSGVSVEKIVVFGSYARGKPRRDSDIDVIIVSKDFRGKDIFQKVEMVSGIDGELVRRTNKPFDILYYSDTEWKKGYSLTINAAKEYGKVLYSA